MVARMLRGKLPCQVVLVAPGGIPFYDERMQSQSVYSEQEKAVAEGHVRNQPCTVCGARLDLKTVLYAYHKWHVLSPRCANCNARRRGDLRAGPLPSKQ